MPSLIYRWMEVPGLIYWWTGDVWSNIQVDWGCLV